MTTIMITILFVHQSADMYGSGKVLLSLVKGLDKRVFKSIVLLQCKGPLLDALQDAGIIVHVIPLVKVSRSTFTLRGLLYLPLDIIIALHQITKRLSDLHIDIVHSNTLAVLAGALWAKVKGIPHVWHVHEMITHPKIVRHTFPWLIRLLSSRVVCNSNPTRQLLIESQPVLIKNSLVIWNGLERKETVNKEVVLKFRTKLGLGANDVLVVLMGRINRWKGQSLLVEAANILWERDVHNIHFLIVGSTPDGQEHFKDKLKSQIADSPARSNITLMGFVKNIWTVWDACDIMVLPSVEPEPFGMVALEAMAAAKPVVASAHGGVTDIVVDGETGILFEPGNSVEFSDILINLAYNEKKRYILGRNGIERLNHKFLLTKYVSSFESLYKSLLGVA